MEGMYLKKAYKTPTIAMTLTTAIKDISTSGLPLFDNFWGKKNHG